MELSIKNLVLLGAVLVTGLSAGLFFAWSVSVIPGTQKINDITYLETMQSINREILNPIFFMVFFGAVLFMGGASIINNGLAFWFMLGALLLYAFGTIGVTGLGNVPLNNQLDALNLTEMSSGEMMQFRISYELKWNQYHLVRTFFACVAFLLTVLALFIQTTNKL